MKPDLTLYIGNGCPFCTRVIMFLEKNNINIPIKDVWSNEQAMQELIINTNRRQVPCLKIDDEWLFESVDIINWLEQHFNAPMAI